MTGPEYRSRATQNHIPRSGSSYRPVPQSNHLNRTRSVVRSGGSLTRENYPNVIADQRYGKEEASSGFIIAGFALLLESGCASGIWPRQGSTDTPSQPDHSGITSVHVARTGKFVYPGMELWGRSGWNQQGPKPLRVKTIVNGHTMTRTWDLTLISGFVSLGKVLYISREEHLALSSWEPHLDPLNAAVDRFRS